MTATLPGTALAVIHNPRMAPRPNGRFAAECSCRPGVTLGVQSYANWTGPLILGVHAQHLAAVGQRERALIAGRRAASAGVLS